jgi:tRNA threonylcarbamoyladenosine biosynthesis protein TsaB
VRAVLIIETSTDAASLALAADGRIIAEKGFVSDRRHNALLFQPLAEILAEQGHPGLDAVLCGSGPGSYSGTRVGIAAAQGAALVAGCKAVAVPSLLATEDALSGEPCLAVGDARRGSFWLADIAGGEMTGDPRLTDKAGFEAALINSRENGIRCFSMEHIRGEEIQLARPTAAGLWQAWQNAPAKTRAQWAGKNPQPIYLAPPHITPSKKAVFGSARTD